jgi:hypothetical protein
MYSRPILVRLQKLCNLFAKAPTALYETHHYHVKESTVRKQKNLPSLPNSKQKIQQGTSEKQ